MHAKDIYAIGDVIAESFDGTSRRIEEIHQAIKSRSFGAAGPAGTIPEAIHDGIADRVYWTVRKLGPASVRMSALTLASMRHPDARRITHGPNGRAAVGALNGLFGETLAKRRNALAIRTAVRVDSCDVQATPEALAAAFPGATPRAAFFIHGFGETEDSWRWYAKNHWDDPELNYGVLLQRELAYTPVYVRYNSGKPIEQNARELSDLLERVVSGWPGEMRELAIVGHSFGAVVAGEAVRYGYGSGARWIEKVSHLFVLGEPTGAAKAELVTQATERVLSRLPETQPLADLLDTRSSGLKDLAEADAEALAELPAAGLQRVQLPADGAKFNHFRLLNHPEIYRQLKAELTARTAPAPGRAAQAMPLGRAATAWRARRRSRRR
jgi:pimeloyl-ACP methyl ester carboxylesterase